MFRALLTALVLMTLPASAAEWTLEPETSVSLDVTWQGRHVEVRFPTLDGRIDFDQDHPEQARALIAVAAADATTGVAVVDRLVRSRDYLDAAQYPSISFRLDRLTQTSRSSADVEGRITLRGVTRPMAFKARVLRYGPAPDDPDGFEAGFELSGRIDRTAFGSTGGLPDVAAVLPVRIRMFMRAR